MQFGGAKMMDDSERLRLLELYGKTRDLPSDGESRDSSPHLHQEDLMPALFGDATPDLEGECSTCWAPFAGPPPEGAMQFGGARMMDDNERHQLLQLYGKPEGSTSERESEDSSRWLPNLPQKDFMPSLFGDDEPDLEDECTTCWAPFAGPPPQDAMQFGGAGVMSQTERQRLLALYGAEDEDQYAPKSCKGGSQTRSGSELPQLDGSTDPSAAAGTSERGNKRSRSASGDTAAETKAPSRKRYRRDEQEEDCPSESSACRPYGSNASRGSSVGGGDSMTEESELGNRIGTHDSRPLPDWSVKILQEWLLSPEHFDFPWPTDAERKALAEEAGITPKRLSIWLTNARKRLWAPLRRKRGLPVLRYGTAKRLREEAEARSSNKATAATRPRRASASASATTKLSPKAAETVPRPAVPEKPFVLDKMREIAHSIASQRSALERQIQTANRREQQLARAHQLLLTQRLRDPGVCNVEPPLEQDPWRVSSGVSLLDSGDGSGWQRPLELDVPARRHSFSSALSPSLSAGKASSVASGPLSAPLGAFNDGWLDDDGARPDLDSSLELMLGGDTDRSTSSSPRP